MAPLFCRFWPKTINLDVLRGYPVENGFFAPLHKESRFWHLFSASWYLFFDFSEFGTLETVRFQETLGRARKSGQTRPRYLFLTTEKGQKLVVSGGHLPCMEGTPKLAVFLHRSIVTRNTFRRFCAENRCPKAENRYTSSKICSCFEQEVFDVQCGVFLFFFNIYSDIFWGAGGTSPVHPVPRNTLWVRHPHVWAQGWRHTGRAVCCGSE